MPYALRYRPEYYEMYRHPRRWALGQADQGPPAEAQPTGPMPQWVWMAALAGGALLLILALRGGGRAYGLRPVSGTIQLARPEPRFGRRRLRRRD